MALKKELLKPLYCPSCGDRSMERCDETIPNYYACGICLYVAEISPRTVEEIAMEGEEELSVFVTECQGKRNSTLVLEPKKWNRFLLSPIKYQDVLLSAKCDLKIVVGSIIKPKLKANALFVKRGELARLEAYADRNCIWLMPSKEK